MDTTDFIILLTACVNPNGMTLTKISDTSIRLNQYLDAIHFYLSHTNCKIVVVENCNYDFSPHFTKEIAENRIECFHFDGNSFDKKLGKGFGEACIIEYAIAHSNFIKHTKSIWKITGRVKIDNISFALKVCNKKPKTIYTFYSRRYPGVFKAVCCGAPVGFWKEFVSRKEQLDDSKKKYFEHLLYDIAMEYLKAGTYDISMFKCSLLYNGYSGTSGKLYQTDTIWQWLKKYLYFTFIFKNKYGK